MHDPATRAVGTGGAVPAAPTSSRRPRVALSRAGRAACHGVLVWASVGAGCALLPLGCTGYPHADNPGPPLGQMAARSRPVSALGPSERRHPLALGELQVRWLPPPAVVFASTGALCVPLPVDHRWLPGVVMTRSVRWASIGLPIVALWWVGICLRRQPIAR
ncbi:MAG: hypothetical protein AAF628_30350 [Planctomycetota bacterium]